MKTRKRISALVLALCLVLSMTVPAVWAAEPETYTYDLDYRSFNNGSSCYLSAVEEAIAAEYDKADSVQNWKFKESYNVETGSGRPLYYRVQADGHVSKSGYAVEYLSVYTPVDGYIALTVKTPAAGTYQVSLIHGRSNSGASDSAVYILDKDTTNIAEAISGAQANDKIGNVNYYSTLGSENPATKSSDWISARETVSNPAMMKTTVGTWEADGEGEHILVLKATAKTETADSTKAYMYPTMLTLTPVEASVNGTNYETLESALSAAESNSTVVLLNDVTVEEALEIPANMTLDLAGKKLEASSVKSFGNIIDSSEKDTGVLVSANVEFSSGNSELPLKSGENSYRFFSFTLKSLGRQTNVADKRFWFELTFDAKEEAYNLINSADNAGLEIQFDLYWKGEKLDLGGDVKLASDKVQSWADNMADGQRYGIYVNVTGFPEAGTFGIAPKIVSNGVTYTASTMTYEHTVEG